MTQQPTELAIFATQIVTAVAPPQEASSGVWIKTLDGTAQARCLAHVPSQCIQPGDALLVTNTADGTWVVVGRLLRDGEQAAGWVQRGADTVLDAPLGNIVLKASNGEVRLESDHRVRSSVGETSVDLTSEGASVVAPSLRVETRDAALKTQTAKLVAKTLATVAEQAIVTAGRIETRAQRVITRADDLYQDVRNQIQTRAGRIRTVAEDTYHLLAERLLMKARGDVKINGEKLYLG